MFDFFNNNTYLLIKYKLIMKNVLFALIATVSVIMVSCNGSTATEEVLTDSTMVDTTSLDSVIVDTTSVDSTSN